MKTQFDHILLSSFYLWFENRLLSDKISAYNTGLNNTFQYVDAYDVPSGYLSYQGQFRQLVAENNISAPNSGFFESSKQISANSSTSNIYLDYENGRLIVPEGSGKNLNFSGVFSVKEINTYLNNDDDEQLIMHGDFLEFGQTTPYFYNKTENLDEKTFFLPACFISLSSSNNKEFSFGGEEDTTSRIKVAVLTNDNYILDSVLSAFRDSVRSYITHIPYENFPYGAFFSIKSFPYSYDTLKESQNSSSGFSFIKEVSSSKVIGESVREKINKNFSIGFIDFDLSTHRFPRL